MAVDKSKLAKDLEAALNSSLPGGDDFEKEDEIKKKNKKIAKMMADSIDKFLKSASVDVSGLETLPGTQVTTNPGQPVVTPGAGATTGPGTGMTSGPGKENPASGIDCCKVY